MTAAGGLPTTMQSISTALCSQTRAITALTMEFTAMSGFTLRRCFHSWRHQTNDTPQAHCHPRGCGAGLLQRGGGTYRHRAGRWVRTRLHAPLHRPGSSAGHDLRGAVGRLPGPAPDSASAHCLSPDDGRRCGSGYAGRSGASCGNRYRAVSVGSGRLHRPGDPSARAGCLRVRGGVRGVSWLCARQGVAIGGPSNRLQPWVYAPHGHAARIGYRHRLPSRPTRRRTGDSQSGGNHWRDRCLVSLPGAWLLKAGVLPAIFLCAADGVVLALLPAARIADRRVLIALRVVAGWLIAVAMLGAILQFLPVTPGYMPDHME